MQESLHEIAANSSWWNFSILFVIIFTRYLLTASVSYMFFYRWSGHGYAKIDPKPPQAKQIKKEILWSISTSAIFALAGLAIIALWNAGHITVYSIEEPINIFLAGLSFIALVFLHETYFYFTHRWMHRPRIFAIMHRTHHESKSPTPFAAFSFHPYEAIIEAAILPLLALLVPAHAFVFLAFLMFMTVLGVTNHLGFEIYPKGTAANWFGRWWIGAVHHQQHHERVSCNYGLYFTFWDQLLGTHREDYRAVFDAVKMREIGVLRAHKTKQIISP
jgi:lathosterol oxidase